MKLGLLLEIDQNNEFQSQNILLIILKLLILENCHGRIQILLEDAVKKKIMI